MNATALKAVSIIAGAIALSAAGVGLRGLAGTAEPVSPEKEIFTAALSNAPGTRLTAVVVSYSPGGKSPPHRHAGSVFAYVLSGAVRSENSATGGARVYNSGQAFFEPVGSVHLVSENASASQPAALLAIFVAPDGARLTELEPR